MPTICGWAQLREAQRLVAKGDPYAELAVINDLGETVDIHPLRKKEVAGRIAQCFDRLVYKEKVNLSPEVVSVEKLGVRSQETGVRSQETGDRRLVLTLDQPVQSGDLYEFEVAGEDGKFYNVDATNTITILLSPDSCLLTPRIIRYAWKDNPIKANVRSLTGLPMSSFELKVSE